MKALITAGGRGTRLRPITHTQNKHLIPIANKPILQYAIEAVVNSGITDIGIVVSPENGNEVKNYFKNGEDFGSKITYIWQNEPLGLAHVVKISEEFINGESFVFYLGDNITIGGINRFVEIFEKNKSDCLLTLAKVPDPERFGVPEFDVNGKIISIIEKPTIPKSEFAVSGIYLYNSSIFKAVNSILPSKRGELEISDAHDWLLKNNYKIDYSEITGWWKDTGMPLDLLEANRLVLSKQEENISGEFDLESDIAGNVVIELGAQVINSRVRGPAIIGKGSKIINSYIGPYSSIGKDCTLINCEVEYSILMDKVKVTDINIRIEGSILANEVEIIHSGRRPKVQRFMLGERSIVELV
ncbi:MAG: glucose-1-phosphate thymidylyltransferase [Chlorobiota bacterium]|jgi:glucose-1-phosphate thymidylyltransferase|nr:glucose-1-phosphate thymidylyltransferase [Chlorobiota bacterium]QQS65626.1 MAG: glucose-1-phosphate thymidylyltransferase [Chlorobiota bacterium]